MIDGRKNEHAGLHLCESVDPLDPIPDVAHHGREEEVDDGERGEVAGSVVTEAIIEVHGGIHSTREDCKEEDPRDHVFELKAVVQHGDAKPASEHAGE